MRIEMVAGLFADLEILELTSWVERGWIHPEGDDAGWEFHEIDVARVRLIHDLRRDMDVTEDALPLVLSLLDQLYDLRRALRRVAAAVHQQPAEVRDALRLAMGELK